MTTCSVDDDDDDDAGAAAAAAAADDDVWEFDLFRNYGFAFIEYHAFLCIWTASMREAGRKHGLLSFGAFQNHGDRLL